MSEIDVMDRSFSYATLNPREDRSELCTIFVHPDATFPLSGYPEFGNTDEVIGCSYQDSDLLFGAGRRGLREAQDRVENSDTPRFFQESLRIRKDDPSIVLRHILAGCNMRNGHPYFRLGFTTPEQEAREAARYEQAVNEKRAQLASRGVFRRAMDGLVEAWRGERLAY